MRRILFPLLIIGVTVGLFSIGSGAFFSDVETSEDNIFTAGSLDLEPNLSGAAICTIPELEPDVASVANDVDFSGTYGDDDCSITVSNVGSLDGDLYLTIAFPVAGDLDVSCTEPEGEAELAGAGSTPGCDADSELEEELDVSTCSAGTSAVCTGATKLEDLAFSCAKVADLVELNAGNTDDFTLTFDLDSDNVTNISQTDSVEIHFTFDLVQDGAATPCS